MKCNNDVQVAAYLGLSWLREQEQANIKDISRTIQALTIWNEPTSPLVEKLLSLKEWETGTSLLDNARACIALCGCGRIHPEMISRIREEQHGENWNNNEIDTAYALVALGKCGIKNEKGCEWLFRNYGPEWEHPGTTSLIITALIKQDNEKYQDFIKERAGWLFTKRENGGWVHTATSNLVIQALILSGEEDIGTSIK